VGWTAPAVMFSTRRTLTPARYISISASSTDDSRRRPGSAATGPRRWGGVALDDRRLKRQRVKLRYRQRHFAGLGAELPVVAAGPRVLVTLGALVLPCAAQPVRLGIQQPVQRLFYGRPDHLVQVRLNAPFVDLHHRPNDRLDSNG